MPEGMMDMDDLEARWPGHLQRRGDVELFVRDAGDGPQAVVFLHGLGGWAGEWWPVASRLLPGFRIVAFDQRGQGRSTRRPDDLGRAAFVADAIGVLETLATPVLLVGQSMGAHTALLVAAERPDLVDRLVLVEGGLGGEGVHLSHEVADWFAGWPAPFASRQDAAAWFETQGWTPQAARVWADGLAEDPHGLVGRFDPDVLLAQLIAVHERNRADAWRTIECPTLLIKGARGQMPADEAQRMLALNPASRLVEVEDAGHDVQLDVPAEVARLLATW